MSASSSSRLSATRRSITRRSSRPGAIIVLYSFAIGQPITLVFNPFEIAAITLSVLATVIVVVDGESNWVEGLQLVSVYVILALAFYFVPAPAG